MCSLVLAPSLPESGLPLMPTLVNLVDVPTVKPSKHRVTPRADLADPITDDPLVKRRKRPSDEWSQHAVALVLIYRSLGQLLPEHYDPDRRSLR